MKHESQKLNNLNGKSAKEHYDTRHLHSRKAKGVKVEDIPGTKALQEAGNIQQAALVFSHEGLGLFTKMFKDTIRDSIQEVLKSEVVPAMDEVVDNKLRQMMIGILQGLGGVAPEVKQEPTQEEPKQEEPKQEEPVKQEEPKQEVKEEPEEVDHSTWESMIRAEAKKEETVEQPKTASSEGKVKLSYTKEDMNLVFPLIKDFVSAQKRSTASTADIKKHLENEHGLVVDNMTYVLSALMKENIEFERVGRGFYQYQETNFRPLI